MKKALLIILVLSCSKIIRNINFRNKNIDEDLALAIYNDDTDKAIELIDQGANVNYCFNGNSILNGKSVLELVLDNKNLDVLKELIKKEVEINRNNVVRIYDLALEDFDYEIIDLIKDKYEIEEGEIDNNKYFLLLCYVSNAEKLEKFIEKNKIKPEEIADKSKRDGLITSAFANKIDIFKVLVEKYKLNINHKNDYGMTPLLVASRFSNKDLIEFIINSGANINDSTALILVSEKGYKEIVELLLERGANINYKEENGWTALMIASQNLHMEIVDLLLEKGANVNEKNNENRTALTISSQKGHIEVVKLLLEKDSNIDDKEEDGWNSLMLASENGYIEIVKLLLEKGAKVDRKENEGDTALMIASMSGRIEVVKLLLEKGADIKEKDNEGWTALMLASQNGYTEVVKLLMDVGANISEKNNDGITALMIASMNGHIEIVKFLLEKGANINGKEDKGHTALMIASQKGHIEVVKLLLEKGADINSKNNDGWSALMIASQGGHIKMVKLLLEKGANVNDKEEDGWNSLMLASQYSYTEIGKLLLEKGINVNERNNYGNTALSMSLNERRKEDFIKILLQKNATIYQNDFNQIFDLLINANDQKSLLKLLFNYNINIKLLSFIYKETLKFNDMYFTHLMKNILNTININKLFSLDNFTLSYKSLLISCFLNFVKTCKLNEIEKIDNIKKLIIENLIEYYEEKENKTEGYEGKFMEKNNNIKNKISSFIPKLMDTINSFEKEFTIEELKDKLAKY